MLERMETNFGTYRLSYQAREDQMEEMEVWRPPLEHPDIVLVLPIYGLIKLSRVVLTEFPALTRVLSLGDCIIKC